MQLPQHQERSTLKSFTRNPPNIQVLRADKRFDALVKKQEGEHQHIISSHHKEMQDLRNNLSFCIEKFESLFNRNNQELSDFKGQTTYHINSLKEKVIANEKVIAEQKQTINDLHEQLLSFQVLYSSMRDVDKMKKEMESQIKEAAASHMISLQDLQRGFKALFDFLKDDLTKFKEDANKRLCELSDLLGVRFNISKIDREGILKEIRIYEKTIFIIEKKIENIYTLIEKELIKEVPHVPSRNSRF